MSVNPRYKILDCLCPQCGLSRVADALAAPIGSRTYTCSRCGVEVLKPRSVDEFFEKFDFAR